MSLCVPLQVLHGILRPHIHHHLLHHLFHSALGSHHWFLWETHAETQKGALDPNYRFLINALNETGIHLLLILTCLH